MSSSENLLIAESPKVEIKERKPRKKLSKAARNYALQYDKLNPLKVKDLKDKIKGIGVKTPLSRLSKPMLIAIYYENIREKKGAKKEEEEAAEEAVVEKSEVTMKKKKKQTSPKKE